MKKIYMKILLWIQGWTGQLNSWAWTKWDKLYRENKDWVKGYNKWKDKKTEINEKIKLFDNEDKKNS
tara:strand:+ start:188 stop:388 length:201 start_codon:yes stop_codon:yes gene_type:complete